MTAAPAYDPGAIETKWQAFWGERDLFRARPYAGEKYYCYNPAPYVTGALHMGHVRNYTYGDFLSRYKRLHGMNVLYTIGFDAFGVPTEVAAIRKRIDPAAWTARCVADMKAQMTRMGLGFDWSRSFCTSDPDYYRWTQWIFIEMFRDGLVYETDAETLWCPRCEMALAKSLTTEGRCGLCNAIVETRVTRQWFLRISRYLDRLRAGLDEVKDYNGQAKAGQESLLSTRSLWGVRLEVPGIEEDILACLESPDDWSRKLVLAVHPQDWGTRMRVGLHPVGTMASKAVATEPLSGRKFAVVVEPSLDDIYADRPRLMPIEDGQPEGERNEPPPGGFTPLTVYSQKDFSISRQRLWGTPIPMVRCERCGVVPVNAGDLPILLPAIEIDEAGRLKRSGGGWQARECPSCGGAAPLDPQVMDCHFDALWHYYRPCVTSVEALPFGSDEIGYWMPVDQIQFGRDTIPFLLTMRLFTKFLQDRGLSACSEFARETLAHGLILMDNRKMSKHLGNVVDPEERIARYGADSLRFYVLARNDPRSDYSWSDRSIERYRELLAAYWEDTVAAVSDGPGGGGGTGDAGSATRAGDTRHAAGAEEVGNLARTGETGDAGDTSKARRSDASRTTPSRKYVKVFLGKVLREVSVLESSVESGRFDVYARAVARLLEALHMFKSGHYEGSDPWARAAWRRCTELSVIYLAPIAPHLAEECWERMGGRGSIFEGSRWPSMGPSEVGRLLEHARGGGKE